MIIHFLKTNTDCKIRRFIIVSVILFLLLPLRGFSQRNEIGIFFGTSYYMGDLNPVSQFAMPRIGVGGLYRLNVNENVAFRLNGFFGSVHANDAIIGYNTNRNLHFRSRISEFSIQGEVNFNYYIPGNVETPYSPYIFAGGGVFTFNPEGEVNGIWQDLRQLNTEGQGSDLYPGREPYNLTSFNILFGMGFKFNITSQLTGAFEWGLRRTGTDYLDDVSTRYPDPEVFQGDPRALEAYDRSLNNAGNNAGFWRGNPNSNDWYSFAGLILTYRIENFMKGRCPAYN